MRFWQRIYSFKLSSAALKVLAVFAWLTGSAFFLLIAPARLIAKDEGYYAYAAQLVAEGKTVYLDFFYPQMPLLPYFYGFFFDLFGPSWLVGRYVSGAITALLLGVLMLICRKHGLLMQILAMVLFCGSNFVFPWFVTVQTYAMASLFGLLAYYFYTEGGRRWHVLLVGMLLGLAVSTRLMFLPLPAIFLVHQFYFGLKRQQLARFYLLLIGLVLGFMPAAVLFFASIDQFIYNNLGYHLSRSHLEFYQAVRQKLRIIKVLFGFVDSSKFVAFQIPILLWATVFFIVGSLLRRRVELLSVIILALFIIHLLPTPSYVQYFSLLVPWLVLALVSLLSQFRSHFGKGALLFVVLFLAGFYLRNFAYDIRNYTTTGRGVLGVETEGNALNWNLGAIEQVQAELNRLLPQGGLVYAGWPGYLLGSRHRIVKGAENQFALFAANQISAESQKRYHLLSGAGINKLIRDSTPDVFMIVYPSIYRPETIMALLAKSQYEKVSELHSVYFYRRK